MAGQLTDGLRAASWMAIEIDVARIDPFDDVHHQWANIAEQPGVVLRAGIDDRWCHARSIAVRVLPDPLLVVDLDTVV